MKTQTDSDTQTTTPAVDGETTQAPATGRQGKGSPDDTADGIRHVGGGRYEVLVGGDALERVKGRENAEARLAELLGGDPAAAADRGVVLLEVAEPYVLHWPRAAAGSPPMRGKAGTCVPSDDPLINTADLDEELRRRLGVIVSDQRFKLRPAPPGAVVTHHANLGAKRVYEALGYDGVPYVAPGGRMPAAPAPRRERTTESVPAIDGET